MASADDELIDRMRSAFRNIAAMQSPSMTTFPGGEKYLSMDKTKDEAKDEAKEEAKGEAKDEAKVEEKEEEKDKQLKRLILSATGVTEKRRCELLKKETRKLVHFPTGSAYKGKWNCAYNNFDGFGKYAFPCGAVYHGKFRDGQFHGPGVLIYPTGERLEAKWVKGRMQNPVFTGSDGAFFSPTGLYLVDDRRYPEEYIHGLKSTCDAQTTFSNRRVIPPGCYDAGDGFYDPTRNVVFDEEGQIITIPTLEDAEWIMAHCRKAWDENVGFRPDMYENWFEEEDVSEVRFLRRILRESKVPTAVEEPPPGRRETSALRWVPVILQRVLERAERELAARELARRAPAAERAPTPESLLADEHEAFVGPTEGPCLDDVIIKAPPPDPDIRKKLSSPFLLEDVELDAMKLKVADLLGKGEVMQKWMAEVAGRKEITEREREKLAQDMLEEALTEPLPPAPRISFDASQPAEYVGPWQKLAKQMFPNMRGRLEEEWRVKAKKWQDELVRLLDERVPLQDALDPTLDQPPRRSILLPAGLDERARKRRKEREKWAREEKEKEALLKAKKEEEGDDNEEEESPRESAGKDSWRLRMMGYGGTSQDGDRPYVEGEDAVRDLGIELDNQELPGREPKKSGVSYSSETKDKKVTTIIE